MYKIKEIATDLGITPQAIYNRKEDLIKQGYMKKNAENYWEITNDGYEFLKEQKRRRVKQKQSSLIQEEKLQKVIKIYEERVEELREQVQYFKKLYEEEKMEKSKLLEQLIKSI
ncbi:MAG: hypothetical protein J6O41_05255 [Clostridia bacterium]|nr:hypothetical protein [Clostridia bacterium]